MRKYINIINDFGKPQKLNEANRPIRRRLRPRDDYGNDPEPEDVNPLHGELTDTPDNAEGHFANLVNTDLGADDIDQEQAMRNRQAYPDDEDFSDFIARKSIETGNVLPSLWKQIKQLPYYMLNNIRSIGRMIFGRITDTPVDDIFVLSGVFGDDDREVRNMVEWLQRYGKKEQYAPYDFSNIMPGYQAKQALYGVDDYQFLIVRDAMGLYVYSWKRDRQTQ